MLKDAHARLVKQSQAYLKFCQTSGTLPDPRLFHSLHHELQVAAQLRPEAQEADVALRQACENLTRDVGESLMQLERWTNREALIQTCGQLRERLAAVTLALEQPHRAAAIWTLTLMTRDAEDRPQTNLSTTLGWSTTREQAERWLHSHGTFEHDYCFAVIEQVRPAPLGTLLSTVRWYRARWDLATDARGNPPVEAMAPPQGFENCGAFGL